MNISDFLNALKVNYPKDEVENLAYKNHNFLKMLNKNTEFGGEFLPIPTGYATPQGRASNFSKALANRNKASKIAKFVLYRKQDYQVITLSDEVIRASKGDANAFMEAREWEIDGAIMNISDSLAQSLQGDGSGIVAKIASVTGQVIKVTDVNDILALSVGQTIVTVAATSGSTPSAPLTITKRDVDNLAITVTGIIAGVAGEFIVSDGDYEDKVTGLKGWLPLVAPTSGDSFLSVDRSVDTDRLAGIRFDGSALPLDEALTKGHARVTMVGQGKPDTILVSYEKYAELVVILGNKVRYVDDTDAKLGFQAIALESSCGPVKIVADLYVPNDRAYVLEMDTWTLHSLGEAPMIFNLDGNDMLREESAMDYQIRIGYYAELGCKAIGRNGVIKL